MLCIMSFGAFASAIANSRHLLARFFAAVRLAGAVLLANALFAIGVDD